VAQIGAAIGREFSYELIAAVSALAPMDLDAALEGLMASGLISRRGTPPDATYAFKHALTHEDVIPGPAIVTTENTTFLVEPGWRLQPTRQGAVWFLQD